MDAVLEDSEYEWRGGRDETVHILSYRGSLGDIGLS